MSKMIAWGNILWAFLLIQIKIKMSKTIGYSRIMEALGRNGTMKQIGLRVSDHIPKERVLILPINSKDLIGRCRIEIPYEDLDLVIETLKEIQNKNQNEQTSR